MKKNLCVLALIAFIVGCASQPRLLYNTLASVQLVTTSAFSGYMDMAIKGKIPTNSVPRISADYNTFQSLWSAAVAVAQYNSNTFAPPQVVAASSNVLYEIRVAEITP